jgi:hypothetical protein
MKVFAAKFLEAPTQGDCQNDVWNWVPGNEKAQKIYASGASTNTRQSTYAAEKDDRADNDRPNEGMLAA